MAPLKILGSLGLSCVLLLLLGLLTWLGTLEQVHMGLYDVQKKYFESLILVHDVGPVPVPLPGAYLVMILLAANLIVGGVIKLRHKRRKLGILTTHAGILLLLFAGLVKLVASEEGHVTLFEGERSGFFQSYYRHELVLTEDLGAGGVREFRVPQERYAGAGRDGPPRLSSADLPFELVVTRAMRNSRVMPKGPMFEVDVPVVDGLFLQEQDDDPEAERNLAGAYVEVLPADGARALTGLLWSRQRAPWVFEVAGRRWALDLRKERYDMPFVIQLDDFEKEDHPRMGMARSFSSDVTVREGGVARQLTISMNEPLRDQGLVVYQSGWGPSTARPGDPLFSTFAVVRNPADQYPLYACIVIALGLLMHFSGRLASYVGREGRTA